MKKNCLLTVCGTFAGNLGDARLFNFCVKLKTTEVALIGGRVGLRRGKLGNWVLVFDDGFW